MVIPTITRKIYFDAGHRVLGHEGKCSRLHGHRYEAEIEVAGNSLDGIGRVIDFGCVKDIVGGWINEHFDHNLILHVDDPLLTLLSHSAVTEELRDRVLANKPPYIMQLGNPTAEVIAAELFSISTGLLQHTGVQVVSVTIHETPNCKAEYRPESK